MLHMLELDYQIWGIKYYNFWFPKGPQQAVGIICYKEHKFPEIKFVGFLFLFGILYRLHLLSCLSWHAWPLPLHPQSALECRASRWGPQGPDLTPEICLIIYCLNKNFTLYFLCIYHSTVLSLCKEERRDDWIKLDRWFSWNLKTGKLLGLNQKLQQFFINFRLMCGESQTR